MREQLLQWVHSKFGDISIRDVFNMKEEVVSDKKNNPIRQINIFLKKKKDIQQDWLKPAVFSQWTEEVRDIVGENILLKLFSTEGNEMRYAGGLVETKEGLEYQEQPGNYYKYEFNLVLWKKIDKDKKDDKRP